MRRAAAVLYTTLCLAGVSDSQNRQRLYLVASAGGLVCRFLNALVWARPPPTSVFRVGAIKGAPSFWFSKPVRVVSLQIQWCRWVSMNGVGVGSLIYSFCLCRRDAWLIAFLDLGSWFGSRSVEICRSQKFWIVSAALEGCFVLFQEKTRITILCCISSASKPYCRRAEFFDLVRSAQVFWARKGRFCCGILCSGVVGSWIFRCWPLILIPLKMYHNHLVNWLTWDCMNSKESLFLVVVVAGSWWYM